MIVRGLLSVLLLAIAAGCPATGMLQEQAILSNYSLEELSKQQELSHHQRSLLRIEQRGGEILFTDDDRGKFAIENAYWVNLEGAEITDVDLVRLIELPALKGLSLRQTKITDVGLINLKGLNTLEHLVLSQTQIGNAGLVHLAELTNLARLHLSGTKITDPGLQVLKSFPSIELVDLRETKLSAQAVADLRAALPAATIYF